MLTRRDFLGGLLLAGGLSPLPGWVTAAPVVPPLDAPFAHLMDTLGLSATEAGGTLRFHGQEPYFPCATPLASAFALPAMACAATAAIAWRQQGGPGQDLFMDIGRAAHGIFPEMTAHPTLDGAPYPGFITDNPIEQSHAYETRDGRFIYAAAVYPHQVSAWLAFLGCAPSRESVRSAIRRWKAQPLEDAANAIGLTACIARTPEEWLAHPQGAYLAGVPLVDIRKLGDSPVEPFRPGPRPLSGVRVLGGTHAIAGPTVGRCLAEHGADVLQFNKPGDFEHEWVYLDANVGTRSTVLDLNIPEQHRHAMDLARQADVFVDNYRGRALGRFGFSPATLAQSRPGIVVVTIRCYGWEGPWAERGGFDMLGCAASGLTWREAVDGRPTLPSTLLINDHVAGYLGAAGATAALIRRAREGGSYHVSVSLTRAAMWYATLGSLDKAALLQAFGPQPHHLPDPDMIERSTPLGKLRRTAPAVHLSITPADWADPILTPKGGSAPRWRDSRPA